MNRTHFDFGNKNTDFDGHDKDCNYFSVSQYSNIVKTPKFFNQLAFVHFNMRSLPKNRHKINSFLGQLSDDCLPSIITITETKISNANAKSINLENYLFEHVDSLPHAGGVGIYIRKDLQYTVKSETINCLNCEGLFIEILNKPKMNKKTVNKSLIVGVIYRQPNTSYASFKEQLCKIMQNFSRSNNTFVLISDYNIDISKQNIDNKIRNYVNETYSSGCFSLIKKPTKITSTSATTLDHIYCNSLQKISVTGILISDVSDHAYILHYEK